MISGFNERYSFVAEAGLVIGEDKAAKGA